MAIQISQDQFILGNKHLSSLALIFFEGISSFCQLDFPIFSAVGFIISCFFLDLCFKLYFVQVRVYDLASMSCSYVLTGHTNVVLCLDTCVSASGRTYIVTGSKDNTVSYMLT